MHDDFETEDYEVGYRKPPKNGQFRKGASGNPSGRPKKSPDFGSQIHRELNSRLPIIENGKRKVITKSEGMAKQLVNKAVSGNLMAARMVIPHYQQELAKMVEQLQISPIDLKDLDPRDLTTDQLLLYLRRETEKEIKDDLEKDMRPKLERKIRAEFKKSMRAELEKSIKAELEISI